MQKGKVALLAPARGFVRQKKEGAALARVGAQAHAGPLSEGKRGPHAAAGGGADPGAHVREAADGVEGVVAAWRLLSSPDRRRALALMSLELQQGSGGGDRDSELWSGAVHEVLVAALGASDGAAHGPQVVRRLLASPGAWAPVREFLDNAIGTALTPAERLAFMRVLARLLVARCRRLAAHADIPLSPKLVAQNTHLLAGIFDNAFPGYLAGGLARTVARMAARGVTPEGEADA